MKPKLIPGIYNYCDRWCERCTFTSRCQSYTRTSELSTEQLDSANKTFWSYLSANLENAIELLCIAAIERGIEPDKLRHC